ncbi:phage major capsid protein [Dyadobacter sp. CY261]|uniref:phage major capsid protein n=1 Tax=Dyadobacter sp. CY261 TaxID=2907203 RepID=UPI001F29B500|nr:phage major capsid protein [Dyadobacter sp. CY261]MCF0074474.1 phage major capsid protein [Dyadobacter sp. CY261]
MGKSVKELRDLYAAKMEAAETASRVGDSEKRDLTAEEFTAFEKLEEEAQDIKRQLDQAEKLEKFQQQRAAGNAAAGGGVPGNKASSDGDQRDLSKFSIARLVQRKIEGLSLDGIEDEVVKEGFAEAARRGIMPAGNVVIPYELFAMNKEGRDMIQAGLMAKRDLTATGGTNGDQGGITVSTQVGRLLNALFNKVVLRQMGATFLPNLSGNLDIPRLVKGTSPTYKTETGAADETSPTLTKASLVPHRLPTFIEVTSQLLRQSQENLEQILMSYLIDELSSIFDRMGIQGSGSANQPTGILNTVGIGAVFAGGAASNATNANGAAPVWADFPNLYREIAVDNADVDSMGYLVNPLMVAKLQTTEKASNTAVFIMPEGAKTINGMKAGVTNNVPSNLTKGTSTDCSAAIFGNFRDLWMGTWGGIDLMINPYSRDTEGIVRINAAMFGDCAVVRPESFSAGKDFKV